jgi:hypothetical protein
MFARAPKPFPQVAARSRPSGGPLSGLAQMQRYAAFCPISKFANFSSARTIAE